MKRISCLLALFVLLSCAHTGVDEEVICLDCDIGPDIRGLIPHGEIVYRIEDSFMPEYDSLRVFYDIFVLKPVFSDTHHDSIRIQRAPYTDSTWYDVIELYGWKQDGEEWRMICKYDPFDDSLPEEDRLLLMDLSNKIFTSIESPLYYIDDEEWNYYRNMYLRPGGTMPLFGRIRLR